MSENLKNGPANLSTRGEGKLSSRACSPLRGRVEMFRVSPPADMHTGCDFTQFHLKPLLSITIGCLANHAGINGQHKRGSNQGWGWVNIIQRPPDKRFRVSMRVTASRSVRAPAPPMKFLEKSKSRTRRFAGEGKVATSTRT